MQRLHQELGKLQERFEQMVSFAIDIKATPLELEADNDGEKLFEENLNRLQAKDGQLQSVITGSAN
jgi:hypothetical protein